MSFAETDRIESSECLCSVGFGDCQMRSVEMGLSSGRACVLNQRRICLDTWLLAHSCPKHILLFCLNPERDQVELNREKLAARSSEGRALCSTRSCAKS